MTRHPRLRTAGRVVAIVFASVLGAAALIAALAPLLIRGAAFGRLVEAGLPDLRGRIEIGGGRWSWGELVAFLRGQTTPFALEDVRVIDPEGTEVLRVARLSGILEREPGPPERLVVRGLEIEDATWKFVRMKREPRVGFLAAFDPKRPPRPGRAPRRPVTQLSIVEANLAGVTAEFDLPTWGLVLNGVRGGASLSYGGPGQGAPAFSFAVHDCDVPAGGHLRILGRPRAFELPFQRGRLDWVGTTAAAPDDIQIAASNVESGRSTLTLAGTFTGVYGRTAASKAPGIDLSARLADAVEAVGDLTRAFGLKQALRGHDAELALSFRGPFSDIEIGAEGRGFDLRHPRVEALKLAFSITTRPLSARLQVDRLSFGSPAGGTVEARGSFDRMQIGGRLAFSRFDAGPYLPAPIRPFAAGTLDGHLTAEIDLLAGRGHSDDVSLVLERPSGVTPRFLRMEVGRTPRRAGSGTGAVRLTRIEVDGGHVRVPRLSLGAFGGTLTAAGSIEVWDAGPRRWIPPVLDLTVQGRRISLARLAGPGFVTGSFSFSSRVRGTASDLTFDATLPSGQSIQFLGERFRLPERLSARLADEAVSFERLRLSGPGDSEIAASGRVALAGPLKLGLEIVKFPFDRLPGLGQTVLPLGGRLSGTLRLEGAAGAPAVNGRLTLASVTFQGRPVGGGEIAIASVAGGGVRARGNLTEAIGLDGVLGPRPGGLGGEATLELRRLPLTPFIPNLPGGLAATGLVSGRLTARVGPGQPASAEGSLSQIVLSVSGPSRPGRASPPIELTSQEPIPISARTGGGAIAVGPARFTSRAGTLELSGGSEGEDLRGRARGRIQLAPFLPYLPAAIDGVAGALEVDLSAARKGTRGRLELRGGLSIATPVSLRTKSPALELRLPSGRVELAGGVLETKALPFSVAADRVSLGPVRRVSASGRLAGRIATSAGGAPAAGRLRAQIEKLELDVPAVGPTPVRLDPRAGAGAIEMRTSGTETQIGAIDLPLAGEARAVASPVAFIDRARFAVRLRGAPSSGLKLSGAVDIDAARADAGKRAPPPPPTPPAKPPRTPPQKPSPLQLAIQNLELDLRVRSHGGAIHVAVPRIPDLRVDASFTVRGTPKRPIVTGGVQGANVYSAILLKLRNLFD